MRFPSGGDNFPDRQTRVVVERPNIQVVDANKAALSYCKTAMLFFIALLVVWYASPRKSFPLSPILTNLVGFLPPSTDSTLL